jgi:hypothetical protein
MQYYLYMKNDMAISIDGHSPRKKCCGHSHSGHSHGTPLERQGWPVFDHSNGASESNAACKCCKLQLSHACKRQQKELGSA